MRNEVWFQSVRGPQGRIYRLLEHTRKDPGLYEVDYRRGHYALRPDDCSFDHFECWVVDEIQGTQALVATLESLDEVLEWLEHGTVL